MPVVTLQFNPSVQTLVKPRDKKRKTVHHLAREEANLLDPELSLKDQQKFDSLFHSCRAR